MDPGTPHPRPGRTVTAPKYAQAAAIVRAQITDGTLGAGQPAPSAAQLARLTGFSQLTCRHALRALTAEGALTPGVSRNARPRVAVPGRPRSGDAVALSRALAARRRAAGLSQPELAALTGYSVTTVGHAETGRYLGFSRSPTLFSQAGLSRTRPRREGQKRQRRGVATR
jgi:hypothetical protein